MSFRRSKNTLKGAAFNSLALAAGALVLGCGAPAGTVGGGGDGMGGPPVGGTVSYSAQIQPIFTTNCAGCHSPGGAADLAGIRLQLTEDVSYDLLVDQTSVQRNDLTMVVPGESPSSLLFLKISSDSPPVGLRMPRFAPPLTESEIEIIRRWIDQGALNN